MHRLLYLYVSRLQVMPPSEIYSQGFRIQNVLFAKLLVGFYCSAATFQEHSVLSGLSFYGNIHS